MTSPEKSAHRTETGARYYLRVLFADRMALASLVYIVVLTCACTVAFFFWGDQSRTQDLQGSLQRPGFDAGLDGLLGTDVLGRPLLLRILVGGFLSLSIAFSAVALAAVAGSLLGLIAGLSNRIVEAMVMRTADILLGLPSILLAVFSLYVLGASPTILITVLAISRIAVFIRVGYAEALRLRGQAFVNAATVIGARPAYIMRRHVVPAATPTILTVAALDVSTVMLAESALSFLGIGVQPPQTTWGSLVSEGQDYVANAWWLSAFSGLAIASTAVALNLLANWVRLALDPQQRDRLLRGQKPRRARVPLSLTARVAVDPQASVTLPGEGRTNG